MTTSESNAHIEQEDDNSPGPSKSEKVAYELPVAESVISNVALPELNTRPNTEEIAAVAATSSAGAVNENSADNVENDELGPPHIIVFARKQNSKSEKGGHSRSRSASPPTRKESNRVIATEEELKANYRDVVQRVRTVLHAPLQETSKGIDNKLGLSLSGCGFLGSYHFGVIICFQNNAKQLMSRVTHVGGASVGSLIAALIALSPDSIEAALEQLYVLADEINANALGAMAPGFCLAERLSMLVDKFVPDDISPAQGRLYVSVTKQANHANRLISSFPSREYLMTCLGASCYIPIYSNGYFATPPMIDGERYVDGGYSNNLPTFNNVPTITISPFSGSAIIAPTDRSLFEWKMRLGNQIMKVNLQNVVRGAQALFPPSTNVLKTYYEMGYRDAIKFLIVNDFFEREEGTEI